MRKFDGEKYLPRVESKLSSLGEVKTLRVYII